MGNAVNVPCLSVALPAFTAQVLGSLQRSGGMYHPALRCSRSSSCRCSAPRRSACAWHVRSGCSVLLFSFTIIFFSLLFYINAVCWFVLTGSSLHVGSVFVLLVMWGVFCSRSTKGFWVVISLTEGDLTLLWLPRRCGLTTELWKSLIYPETKPFWDCDVFQRSEPAAFSAFCC